MSNFLFTVVIPNYNKEKYLAQCIDSIYNQTLTPKEVIIVDDCSSDKSREIIISKQKNYPNLKALFLDYRGGVSNARNCGIDQCSTPYITFLDSDDFLYNNKKYENEINFLKLNNNQNCLVYSPIFRVDNNGDPLIQHHIRKRKFITGNATVDLLAFNKNYFIPCDFMVKTAFVKRIGNFPVGMNLYEDLDLLIRLSYICKFKSTFEWGKAYRYTPDGLSKASSDRHKQAMSELRNMYYPQFTRSQKCKFKLLIMKNKLIKFIKNQIKRTVIYKSKNKGKV